MPSLNVYQDILVPWKEILDADERIGGKGIPVTYVRREPEEVDINRMPYIDYFLDPSWEDDAFGTGSYSPQSRRVNMRIGFLLALMHADAAKLDQALFLVGGDLLDIIREHELFNNQKSIIIKRNVSWLFDSIGVETGQQIGTQRISVPMEQFTNF